MPHLETSVDSISLSEWTKTVVGQLCKVHVVMKMDFATQDGKKAESKSGRRVTAFTAMRPDYGFQLKVACCVCLQSAQNGSKNVIGIVKLNDQVVPILASRNETGCSISDQACIVLFENMVGQTMIVTGRLYESACQVFDLIVECMDEPETHEHLYAISEHHHFCETSE